MNKENLFIEPWTAALSNENLVQSELLEPICGLVRDIANARGIIFLEHEFSYD
jgi:hypothetical protein